MSFIHAHRGGVRSLAQALCRGACRAASEERLAFGAAGGEESNHRVALPQLQFSSSGLSCAAATAAPKQWHHPFAWLLTAAVDGPAVVHSVRLGAVPNALAGVDRASVSKFFVFSLEHARCKNVNNGRVDPKNNLDPTTFGRKHAC